MNYRMMGKIISQTLAFEAAFMIVPVIICAGEGAGRTMLSFLITMLATLGVAGVLFFLCKNAKKGFYAREGLVCVGLSWLIMSLVGCIPFCASGEIPKFIDAFFETASGFTTTGSSILSDIEALSKGALYWRSFTHWVGGMGVLVFLLAVAPREKKNGGFTMHLLRAESPGPIVGKLVPKIKQSAMILYILYIILTLLDVIFLVLDPEMPVFDAVCTAFGTAGTGGFSVRNIGLSYYSPYVQNVCTVFMLLFGANFTCYYFLLMRNFKGFFRNTEIRAYFGWVFISTVMVFINIRSLYDTAEEAVRHAAFQVASITTTTGFASTDFDTWPTLSKSILLAMMFIGACAGSTGGGFKVQRVILLVKDLRRNIHQVLHPNEVRTVSMDDQRVSEKVLKNTGMYLIAYVLIIVISTLLISVDGFTLTTNISAVAACTNNIGPGFEQVGPTLNYAGYSAFSKLVLIGDMLAGRLEIFPILVLFSRSTWKKSL
ncbi:MAG: TrkH family potassium uptake protein [Clostridia bacterium]|nr:TrkH family potassium uptake protein [Clostridia bacterium]